MKEIDENVVNIKATVRLFTLNDNRALLMLTDISSQKREKKKCLLVTVAYSTQILIPQWSSTYGNNNSNIFIKYI